VELNDAAVAGALDDAAMMRGNGGREQHECAGFLGGALNAAGGLSVSPAEGTAVRAEKACAVA
jgi:hypothetical protein